MRRSESTFKISRLAAQFFALTLVAIHLFTEHPHRAILMVDDYGDYITSTGQTQPGVARIDTISSSISTNATAPNLPGPGRNVGLLLDRLGAHMEKYMNLWADRRGLGPNAAAQEIRRLLRHDETSLIERHAGSVAQLSKRDEKIVRKLCKRLLKYARFVLQKLFSALYSSYSR